MPTGYKPRQFNFVDKTTTNACLHKLDSGARLLLKQASYGALMVSYLDQLQSDEGRREVVKNLSELFLAMADVSARIAANSVSARRSLYLRDMAFKNKATEKKLLCMSTLGPNIFGGKFFEVLQGSADNLRNAKETQHTRFRTQTSLKRRREPSSERKEEGYPHKVFNPCQNRGVRVTRFGSREQNKVVKKEIQELLEKQAIERVPVSQVGSGYYSTFFMVPKKDGGFRPILNLKSLNTHLKVPHFKMETFRTIRLALKVGDWAITLDLRDAYFHVPIFPSHRRFLRFVYKNTHYQFQALPFGIAVAPRIFTKILTALAGFFRNRQIHIYMYLDDWIVRNQEREVLYEQRELILVTLDMVGLILNKKKSDLVPTQSVSYLGAVFDLRLGIIFPSEERYLNMVKQIDIISLSEECEAQKFLRLLGLMSSCMDLIPKARLQMRPTQYHLRSRWNAALDTLKKKVTVTAELVRHLSWWKKRENFFKGVPLIQADNIVLWTDASEEGWGAHLDSLQTKGVWDLTQKKNHINWLELKAVHLALISFLPQVEKKNVLIRTDNSTVVAYINKEGGTRSLPLCLLMWEIFNWAENFNINLRAAHIPGKKNVIADSLSRSRKYHKLTEWSLDTEVVKKIFQIFYTPNIDLFATRENRQLAVFCSPRPTEGAWCTDALSANWKGMYAYAFPPQILLHRVLRKVQQEPCTLILIAPLSPTQSWFPVLLELVIDYPRLLPGIPKLLTQEKGRLIHPDPSSLKLAAWKISGVIEETRIFQKKLKDISLRAKDHPREIYTRPDSEFMTAGVVNDRLIQVLPL